MIISETSLWKDASVFILHSGRFCSHFRIQFQALVTQERSLTMSPGQRVTLTCGSSTGAVTNGHYPYWFQQKSGHVLQDTDL